MKKITFSEALLRRLIVIVKKIDDKSMRRSSLLLCFGLFCGIDMCHGFEKAIGYSALLFIALEVLYLVSCIIGASYGKDEKERNVFLERLGAPVDTNEHEGSTKPTTDSIAHDMHLHA